MRKQTSIIVGGLIVALALAAATGAANARRFALSENHFLSHFRELAFENGGGTQVICAASIEGSFHSRTLAKVARSLIGYVTEVQVNSNACTNGRARALSETLPWHILYERFIGALPNITGVELTLDNAAFLVFINVINSSCLYLATTTSPMKGIVNRENGGKATGLRANERAGIPFHEGGILCPTTGFLRGEGIVGDQVTYREITITLVM